MFNNKTRFQVNTTEEFKEMLDDYVEMNKDLYVNRSHFIEEAIKNMIEEDQNIKNTESNMNNKLNYMDSNIELILQMLVGFMFNNEMAGMDDYYKESIIYMKAQKALDQYYKDKKMNEFTKNLFTKEKSSIDFLSNFDEL